MSHSVRLLSLVVASIAATSFSHLSIADTSANSGDVGNRVKTLADVMPVKSARTSYEYERCFSDCQKMLDQMLSYCLLETDPEKVDKRFTCEQRAIESFEKALARCPVDTGRRER